MKVLVTGGAGYIGSTTAKALEEAGHTPVILDSLLTGPQVFVRDRIFYEGDIADRDLLTRVVEEHPDLDATIHMAARIVVPESVEQPYLYYRDNVAKSLELFDQLDKLGKPRVLFSSSASLYATKPGLRGPRGRPARAQLAVRPHQADDGAGAAGHGGRHRAARHHPALLQPDRLRPRPRVRHLRQGAEPRARPAGHGGARAEGLLHDHRHGAPHPRRHRHPRLHPRVGPGPGPRPRRREVRRGARLPWASRAWSSTSAPARG